MSVYSAIDKLSQLARQRVAEAAKNRVQQAKQGKALWQGFDEKGNGVVLQDGVKKTVKVVGNVSLPKDSAVFIDAQGTVEFTNRKKEETQPPAKTPAKDTPKPVSKKKSGIPMDEDQTTIRWSLTQSGNSAPYGWTLSQEDLKIRYDVQDSSNCGGSNGNIQSGIATALIKSDSEGTIKLDVTGSGEVQDAGYEVLKVTLNGVLVVDGHAPGGGRGCGSGPAVITYHNSSSTFEIKEGENTLILDFSTRDARYHNGAFYQVIISSEDLTIEKEEVQA